MSSAGERLTQERGRRLLPRRPHLSLPGRREAPTVWLIDGENPQNNDFAIGVEVTIKMILREHYSYLRNLKIAGVFYRACLVERYGSGIERIIVAARTALRDLNDMVTQHVLERRGTSRRDTHYVLFREKKGSL
jgi:predicted HTH transcriptional regulator